MLGGQAGTRNQHASLPGFGATSPQEGEQIVFLTCLDVYHKSPDSGECQYKSRTKKNAI